MVPDTVIRKSSRRNKNRQWLSINKLGYCRWQYHTKRCEIPLVSASDHSSHLKLIFMRKKWAMNETSNWSWGQPMIRPKIILWPLQIIHHRPQSLPQVRSSMRNGLQEISCSVMLLGVKFG